MAPIVLNTPRTLLADFFEDDLFYAIPRNPGATLRIIAQYFPDKLESICDGTHFPYTYDPTDKEDDGNLSLNTNVPDAIKGLTALKLNDPKLIKVRDQCVAYLKVDTLKITDRADVDDAS